MRSHTMTMTPLILSLALLAPAPTDAQSLAPQDLERLRNATGGELADLERLRQAVGGGVVDSLRTSDPRASMLGAEKVPATEPPAAVTAPAPDDAGLVPFGYDIFTSAPNGFSTDTAPVGASYVVGNGDELVLTLWGDTELVQNATVDREGRVFFRDIGLFAASGKRLSELKREVQSRLSRVYSGITGDRPSTFFDVTVGRLSTVQVFVFGEVTRPGAYRVPSNGTVLDVLYRAGGASESGSLRDIRVVRGGREVGSFDLYRALVDGDITSDTRLETGDVVLIPPVGPRVHLAGAVHRPAVYELRSGETLRDVLRIAGGLRPEAYLERGIVERIDPSRPMSDGREYDWTVITLDRRALSGESAFGLEDGDRVDILEISRTRGGYVQLDGTGLWRPGRVAWKRGLTIGEAIRHAGGLRRDAALEEVQVVRTVAAGHEEVHSLRLDQALNGHSDADFALMDLDRVLLRGAGDFVDPDSVAIVGQVRQPGTFPLRAGLTLQDLIFQAGGLKDEAFKLHAEVARIDPSAEERSQGTELFRVSLEGWERGSGEAAVFVLEPLDQVHVWTLPGWQHQRNVQVLGEVKLPGTYAITRPGETITDVIARAGGLTGRAYPDATVLTRLRGNAGRIAVNLDDAIEKPGGREDVVLEPDDVIQIPERPYTVKIEGAVGLPSSVLHRPGKRVGYYIDQAGGLTEMADGDRVLLTLASGEVKRGTGGFLRRAPKVDAGSVIRVPTKEPSEAGTTLRDLSSIVSILTGTATTIYLISQVSQ